MGTWHHSSGHVEAASHIPQVEGPATRIYNYVPGGVWEIKQEKKRLATVVSSGAKLKGEKRFFIFFLRKISPELTTASPPLFG